MNEWKGELNLEVKDMNDGSKGYYMEGVDTEHDGAYNFNITMYSDKNDISISLGNSTFFTILSKDVKEQFMEYVEAGEVRSIQIKERDENPMAGGKRRKVRKTRRVKGTRRR